MLPCDQSITAAILETSLDAVFTIRADGTIVDSNSAATRQFGWSKAELLGRNIACIVPEPMRGKHDGFLQHFDPARGISHILGNGKVLLAERKDGSCFPVEVGISCFEAGGERFFTGFVRDMTERQRHIDHLHYLASHDPDTGVLNYRGLMAECTEGGGAALYLQMNGFHRIVAAQGRRAGEHILKTAATRLQHCLMANGSGAAVARVGEAAFALFAEQDERGVAKGCLDALQAPIPFAHMALRLTASIGISGHERDAAQRLRDAMTACEHLDVNAGGILVFSSELSDKLQRDLYVESRLRTAIEENALRLTLQPKLDLKSETIVGAEALIRWQDAELGWVMPADFIPIAERSGQIGDISDWVLTRSLEEIRRHAGRGLSVAVNFSAQDFQQSDVGARVASALARADVQASQLEIELTESIVAENPAATAQRMGELKKRGVALSIDDFGTGYSSLSYLRQFPLDTLKIDASFVRHTPDDADANAIAGAIAALARALNLSTVAEGVETRAQANFLKSLAVDQCQGYLFSRPLAPADFHELVEHQARERGAE
ncbi:putative bifunctional diguanylate cyclase/phosphodiesterase [Paludibacterium yongneupense]|uniref:putative bifunctional diguanylate cyclase/phosphodiesterase n=1 Tax=Paludibacterium yongneupense TaxID=400061 RepID=UPI0003F73A82|nr:EAL domain-containing protein [Paludibacterium yongneupense]